MVCTATLNLDAVGDAESLVPWQGAGNVGFADLSVDLACSYYQPLKPSSQSAPPHSGGCRRLGKSDCSLVSARTGNHVGCSFKHLAVHRLALD